jgi:hypothetical protein
MSLFKEFGSWEAMTTAIQGDADVKARAEREFAALSDDICKRDHSARVYRARLRQALNAPGPTLAEEEAAHEKLMQETIDALKKKNAQEEAER